VRQKALGLAVAMIIGVALVSASGAATTKTQNVTKINVSTRTAVVHYLRSIHVNAKHAVIQRGLRNYAGAHCPGTRWACASTKHTVVQITKQSGQNRFVCRSSKCVVVQISGVSHGVYLSGRISTAAPNKGGNSGYCVKTGSGTLSGGGQTCSIMQTATASGANTAGIYEVTAKVSGLVQTVQFAATIKQTASSGNNTACVTQGISQTASTTNTNGKSTNVTLEATQTIVIRQDSASGNNSAVNGANPTTGTCSSQTLSQSQNQTSIVTATGDITQNMNPTPNGVTDGNASLDIEQNQAPRGVGTGTNSANFSQATNQQAVANTKAGKTVTQLQNSTDGDGTAGPFSGIVGTINQDSTGQSTATVTQDEIQCEDAANTSTSSALGGCSTTSDVVTGIKLNQTQNGPVGLFTPLAKSAGRVPYYHKGNGKSELTGAVAPAVDTFILTQTSSQYADKEHDPNTLLGTTVNQSNIMQGDCASSGNGSATGGTCTASQQARLNGLTSGITNDGYTAGSISELVIKCTNGHDSCEPTPPPDPTLTATPPVNINGETNATSASFEFTDPAKSGAHFNCTLDTATVSPCGSPTVNSHNLLDGTKTYSGLGFGPHTFTVTATDGSGNESGTTATFTWTVVPPDPTITASSEPTDPDFFGTSDTFQFTDTADPNVHYKCTLDGTPTGCNGGSITYTSTDLAPGSHTFSVRAFDTSDTYGSLNSASYAWTILPLQVSALGGSDGSSAGWACQPGGPIGLTVGPTPYPPGTFAQVAITNAGGTAIDDLSEPTFTTDNFNNGSPRYTIDLSNGDHLWGYPPNAQMGTSAMLWDGSVGYGKTWSQVQAIESGQTVTDAIVIADGDQVSGTTDKIGNLQFNGITFNSGTCS
jgi:hypothetical protein